MARTYLAPPPPQKKRPTEPLPPPPSPSHGRRRRSSTFSAIASWAAHVQPGSPAALSPHRRSGRRGSLLSTRAPSTALLHVAPTPTTAFTPTPSVHDFKTDLTTVGYSSVFLQLPNTPSSATPSFPVKRPSPKAVNNLPIPSSACKPRGLTRFRSLSIVRSRGRHKSAGPDSPTKFKAKAAAILKRKKAEYAIRPPPLANELALMQLTDGGSMDDNVKRMMEAHAKAAGVPGLADVYRDGKGGIWWDQDEELEYTHLLLDGDESRSHVAGDLQWVTFGSTSPSMTGVHGDERRGSVSTQDSDLDPKYVIQPADVLVGDDLALFSSAVTPTCKPVTSVLSLPYRPRRTVQHLRKADFLADVAFSPPQSSISPGVSVGTKPKGKARRRPAPLKLFPQSSACKRPTNSPVDADKIRKDFIAASFEPLHSMSVPVTPAPTTPATARLLGNSRAANVPWQGAMNDGLTMKRKPSVLNRMGLFRSTRKEDMMA